MDYDQETLTKEQKLEADFDSCVVGGAAFSTEVAIYSLSLGEDKSPECAEARNTAIESSKPCQMTVAMLADQDMPQEKEWSLLCEKIEGAQFARDFVDYSMKKIPELQQTGFSSLITCLDKTNAIINSVLNPNGTQHT